jgi:hypothetical protein
VTPVVHTGAVVGAGGGDPLGDKVSVLLLKVPVTPERFTVVMHVKVPAVAFSEQVAGTVCAATGAAGAARVVSTNADTARASGRIDNEGW